MYFQTVSTQRSGIHGKDSHINYFKVWENGMMTYVNTLYNRLSITQSPVTPYKMRPCTKADFDKAVKKVLSQILI